MQKALPKSPQEGYNDAAVFSDINADDDNFDDNDSLLIATISNLETSEDTQKVVDNQINNKHHYIQHAKESIAKGIVATMPKGKLTTSEIKNIVEEKHNLPENKEKQEPTTHSASTVHTVYTLDTAEKEQQKSIAENQKIVSIAPSSISPKKTFEPGIYDNIDIDEYHNSDGISSSGISLILDCPARYYYEYYIKDHASTSKQQNEKYKIGRAVHMLVLEPDKFHSTFFCMDTHVNLTTKVGKEIYAQAELEAKGRDIIRFFEWQEIKNIADAVKKHPVWKNISIKDGKIEQSIFWKGGTFDTLLKSRPDFFNDQIIIDLKTTECIKTFSHSIYSYGYHRQAAMQIDALKQSDGKERFFAFFVVEKKEPYLTACYTLDKESLIIGEKEYLDAAALYTECLMYNEWPGYANNFQLISIPKWAIKNNLNEGAR
jgi:hypothetical protein